MTNIGNVGDMFLLSFFVDNEMFSMLLVFEEMFLK